MGVYGPHTQIKCLFKALSYHTRVGAECKSMYFNRSTSKMYAYKCEYILLQCTEVQVKVHILFFFKVGKHNKNYGHMYKENLNIFSDEISALSLT